MVGAGMDSVGTGTGDTGGYFGFPLVAAMTVLDDELFCGMLSIFD